MKREYIQFGALICMMMLFNLAACGTKDAGADKAAGHVVEEGINDLGKSL